MSADERALVLASVDELCRGVIAPRAAAIDASAAFPHDVYAAIAELGLLAAFVDRVLPGAPGRPSAREARVAERIDRELVFHPKKLQEDVKGALFLLEHGGWLHLSPSRFTSREPEEQDRYLARMAAGTSLERQAFQSLRVMTVFFYYCDERTWESIHYEGPLVRIPAPPEADSALVPKRELD
jgi:alkylation response protein AidB-like acyl-CoA dehydrogenase